MPQSYLSNTLHTAVQITNKHIYDGKIEDIFLSDLVINGV